MSEPSAYPDSLEPGDCPPRKLRAARFNLYSLPLGSCSPPCPLCARGEGSQRVAERRGGQCARPARQRVGVAVFAYARQERYSLPLHSFKMSSPSQSSLMEFRKSDRFCTGFCRLLLQVFWGTFGKELAQFPAPKKTFQSQTIQAS